MGVVYHRGRSQIASISESHGGDLIIQRYDQSGWRVGLLQCLHSFKGAQQVRGQGRVSEVAIKEAKENRIGTSPATRWRRPCMRVAVCLSIDHGELLGGHSGVEVGGRKGRESDDEFGEAQLPKTQSPSNLAFSTTKRMGEVEYPSSLTYPAEEFCISSRRDFRGVIDPLLSWRESIGRKRSEEVENAKANSKYQDKAEGQRPRNFIRPVSMGFSSRWDFGLVQECSTKEQSRQYAVLYLFYSEE
ncbi:hypothetical protein BHE74_00011676 [Ensete ventricosum]|nr:hypothetical protein BHE74_00011676 [Ensete ventricosum]